MTIVIEHYSNSKNNSNTDSNSNSNSSIISICNSNSKPYVYITNKFVGLYCHNTLSSLIIRTYFLYTMLPNFSSDLFFIIVYN